MTGSSLRSMRRAYVEWVEEQVETFKDTIPRSELLSLADEVATELRMTRGGQYQLTELLMCAAVDRHIVRRLRLPGYRRWVELMRQAEASLIPSDLSLPAPRVPAMKLVAEAEAGAPVPVPA